MDIDILDPIHCSFIPSIDSDLSPSSPPLFVVIIGYAYKRGGGGETGLEDGEEMEKDAVSSFFASLIFPCSLAYLDRPAIGWIGERQTVPLPSFVAAFPLRCLTKNDGPQT